MAYLGLLKFCFRISDNVSEAQGITILIASGYSILVAFLLHLSMVLDSNHVLLQRKWIYGLIYLPALLNILLFFSYSDGSLVKKSENGLFIVKPDKEFFLLLSGSWILIVMIITSYYFIRQFVLHKEKPQKRHGYFIIAGYFLFSMVFITSEIVLPFIAPEFPHLSLVGAVIGFILIGIGIHQHTFLDLNPRQAAQNIFSTIQDSIVMVNNEGTIKSINKNTLRMLEYEEKELIDQNIDKILNHQSAEVKDFTGEMHYFTKTGKRIPVMISTSRIIDPFNNIKGYIYIGKDMTRTKIAEDKIKEYTSQLQMELEGKIRSLHKAQHLQKNLITKKLPNISDCNLLAYYMPSEEIGGDILDIQKIDNKLLIILADCTGHGIEASMDSVLLKSISDRYIHYLLDLETNHYLNALNKDFYNYFNGEKFLTLFAAVLDLETKVLFYSNANGELPLIINQGFIKQLIRPNGIHIGYDYNYHYEKRSIKLRPHDLLFLYSDAIKEMPLRDGRIFGQENLCELIKTFGPSLQKNQVYFIKQLEQINGRLPLNDDTTMIMVHLINHYHQNEVFFNLKELQEFQLHIEQKLLEYDYSRGEINDITVGYEEMYLNAINHGNHYDPGKKVYISFYVDCNLVKIVVEDEGEGFSMEKVPDPTDIHRLIELMDKDEEQDYTHGRGIYLTKRYMDDVIYNEKGNKVIILKYRKNKETTFHYTWNKAQSTQAKKEPYNSDAIVWYKNIDEQKIIQMKKKVITILFDKSHITSSVEIAKLMLIIKHCRDSHKRVQFKVESEYLKNILLGLGFKQLGVKFI